VPGAKYNISGCGADGNVTVTMTAEAGGTFTGDANGGVQGGKLVMQAAGIDYTGSFISKDKCEAQWKDPSGSNGSGLLTFT
jgi:hypothetical protein